MIDDLNKPKIFVQIASYRDPELLWTVKSIYENAKYPERIFVGICNQLDFEEDRDLISKIYPFKENVREIIVPSDQVKGGVWARSQAQSLWRGEEYVLQLDAHMRFLPNWDEYLISTLKKCPSDKPILSSMVTGYQPPDNLELVKKGYRCMTFIKSVYANRIGNPINLAGGIYKNEGKREGLLRSPFIIGNFIFGKSQFFLDVPLDPHIYFHGYETSFSARLWTYGYDIFQPDENFVYHNWGKTMTKSESYKSDKEKLQKQSIDRVKHLLKLKNCEDKNALINIEKYGLGNLRSLESFWQFAGADLVNGIIKDHAKQGFFEESYKTAIELEKIKSMNKNINSDKKTIFVQIASYRDPELIWTIKSIYETAKYPERVFIGICNQIDLETDKEFNSEPYPFKDNIQELIVPAKESKGVCWARHIAQKFYRDEDYVLMIDSHMRFIKDWDELFIEELKLCNSEKPIFANYPAPYTPPNDLKPINAAIVQVAKPFNDQGNLRFTSRTFSKATEKPLKGAFIAAGFLFSKGSLIKEVPYDPYMYFGQEEISLALRFYTHGWDVFSPRKNFIYHMYIKVGEDRKRTLQWEDNKDWTKQSTTGKKRFEYLTNGAKDKNSDEYLFEIDKYGLGKVRSLKQFEEYTGINFSKKEVSDLGLKGWFIEDIEKYIPAAEGELIRKFKNEKHSEKSQKINIADIGNEIPNFILTDNFGKSLEIAEFRGKNSVIFFLPINLKIYIRDFFNYLNEKNELVSELDFNRVYILHCTEQEAQNIKDEFSIEATFFNDKNADIYKTIGLEINTKLQPVSIVLDRNLCVKAKYTSNNAINNLADVFRALK